ncbi:PREDICTED: UPF0488 protein C8orf33 homolog [Amphimedon queenslandica]|uniref:Uncharacterized protein n=1 Tax=Amphimedon queenslandica TaxID=400682 RepID=A0A1X7U359_AMPQE|nr:PREDICTED: UPF0488 protein C8orf33 homolog [Amphimedon queenslandica]|eukprot:XP_011406122.1 PREDICTED: UPF0488 protein C8orf33 homolog [Amphimedon queenslandica]
MAEAPEKRKKRKSKKNQDTNPPEALSAAAPSVVETKCSNFEEELSWCVRQLELGLLRPKDKGGTSQQKQEAQGILNKLRSSKTPLPRKRQLMKLTFGDYRSKMKQEEEKVERERQAFVRISTDTVKAGQFYKASQAKDILQKDKGGARFKFNFQIEADD